MRKPKITDKDQRIVADILNTFIFCDNMEEIIENMERTARFFCLVKDDYAGCYYSPKEAYENSVQHQKDLMIDKYGHCDGLE